MSCTIGGDLVPSPKTCESEFLSALNTHDIAPTDIARSIPVPGGDDMGLRIRGLGEGAALRTGPAVIQPGSAHSGHCDLLFVLARGCF